jgi:hypothetical protein
VAGAETLAGSRARSECVYALIENLVLGDQKDLVGE